MFKLDRYSNITEEMKAAIAKSFDNWSALNGAHKDYGHIAACVANDVFCRTNKQWNSKYGADAFAATLTALVMMGKVKLAN